MGKLDYAERPCPPGFHRHGGHDYCHEVGRKHRTHAGEATHGLKYPKERTTRPRAKANPMARVGEVMRQVDNLSGAPSMQRNFTRPIIELVEKLRGRVSHGTHAKLRRAAAMMGEGKYDEAVLSMRSAIKEEMASILQESKMRKAEKKRDDAEPTVTYDEPFAEIYEVDNRLKAVRKALERQITRQTEPEVMRPSTRQISGNLRNLEKRVRKLPGCC